MATVETEPEPMEFESQPESWSDEWNYVVERQNGDEGHDRVLNERAGKVDELMNKPLPEDVVRDIDDLISIRWQQHDDEDSSVSPESSFFDREIDKISKEALVEEGKDHEEGDSGSQYINLMNDLGGTRNKEGRAKSLNEIWEETEQLTGAKKGRQLRALRVVSFAMKKTQPSHESEGGWAELDEEGKVWARVAEINRLKVDVEIADAVYSSNERTDEQKVQRAQELGEVLEDYASGDDIPEGVRVKLKEAAARAESVVSNQEEKEVGGGQEVEADSSANERQENAPRVKPVVDRERLRQEDVPLIEKQLRESLKNKEHFKAAQLMAKMKRVGVVFKKKEGNDREERIKKYLVDGWEKVSKKSEEDSGVSAARYLSYLKYTGALGSDSVTDEKKKKMIDDVRVSFEKAAEEKKSDVNFNWSLYAMHAKYVGAIDKVNDEQVALLTGQALGIKGAGGSIDEVVVNEARLKYVNEESWVDVSDREVQEKLAGYKEVNDYGAYAKLAVAYRYSGEKVLVSDNDVEGLQQYLETRRDEAVRDGKWDKYLVDAANAVKVVGERGGVDHVTQAVDEVAEVSGGESEQEGASVLDDEPRATEESAGDTVVAGETTVETGGSVDEEIPTISGSAIVDEEAFPERAEFNRKVERRREMQREEASEKSIFDLSKNRLGAREQEIQERKDERRASGDKSQQWAQAVVDEGIDLTDEEQEGLSRSETIAEREKRVQWLEKVLDDRASRAAVAKPEQESALDDYHEMWLNELGRLDAIKKNDRISRFTEWAVARYRLGDVKERIETRQAYIDMLRDEALDEDNIGGVKLNTLRALADELEELSIRERLGSLKAKENRKLERKEKRGAQYKEARDAMGEKEEKKKKKKKKGKKSKDKKKKGKKKTSKKKKKKVE